MPGMQDAARGAAIDAMGGGGSPNPDEGQDAAAGAPPDQGGDFAGMIAPVEDFFNGQPGDISQQANGHINALKDLAAQGGGGDQAAPAEPGAEAGAPGEGGPDISALMQGMGG